MSIVLSCKCDGKFLFLEKPHSIFFKVLFCFAAFIAVSAEGSIWAPADGIGNNLLHPYWGSTGHHFSRAGPAAYADGISAVREGPGARNISNLLFSRGPWRYNSKDVSLMTAGMHGSLQFLPVFFALSPTLLTFSICLNSAHTPMTQPGANLSHTI